VAAGGTADEVEDVVADVVADGMGDRVFKATPSLSFPIVY
jgi:hypothetical protein